MDSPSLVPPDPTRYPTYSNSFTRTKLEALVLVEACISERLRFCPPESFRGESGSIFVYEGGVPCASELDNNEWILIEFDGLANISRLADSSLHKKEMSIRVRGAIYQLVSYYSQWDTVNGRLSSPTDDLGLQDVMIRGEMVAHKDLRGLSRMENFRMSMKALNPQRQSDFMKNVVFLSLTWTDEIHHQALLQRSQQLLFPTIPSSEKYWVELTSQAVFDGKSGPELAYQMKTLLSMLLWLSDGADKPQHLKSSPGFTPLQNVNIYIKAFGVKTDPLEAFDPPDIEKLTEALGRSPLFPKSEDMNIHRIESWDTRMQNYPPIKRPQDLISIVRLHDVHKLILSRSRRQLSPCSLQRRNQFEPPRREQTCQTFPRFRRGEFYEFVLLHECSPNVWDMLGHWTNSKDGQRAKVGLMRAFQSPLAPEELALTLSVMGVLWVHDPAEEDDEFQSPPANLQSLAELLSSPDTIGEHEELLLELHRSFHSAAESLVLENIASIKQLLGDSMGYGQSSRSEELLLYFVKRLGGKGHRDAVNLGV